MEILLIFSSADDPGLFEQVVEDLNPPDLQSAVDPNTQKFAKTGGIVVPDGFGVTEGLEYGSAERKDAIYLLVDS